VSRPERQLDPNRSPLDRFGYELRMRRKAHGLSQDRLGVLVHVSGDLIYRIELAERRPSRDLADRCDQVLKADGLFTRLLAEVNADSSKPQSLERDTDRLTDGLNVDTINRGDSGIAALGSGWVTVPAGILSRNGAPIVMATEVTDGTLPDGRGGDDLAVIPCQTSDGRIILVSIPRRTFLGMGATVAGVAAASSLTSAGPPIFTGGMRAVAGDPFDRFYKMRKVLRDADNLFGPERVKPLVHEQIGLIRQLSASAKGQDRTRLLQVQAQFADLYAWLQQDTGYHQEAQFWLDRALDWAQIADNTEAVSFILARKSQLAGELNDATDAIDVAEIAIRRAQSHHWRAATVAATYGAHGNALLGDKSACERGYERAVEMLAQVQPEPETQYGLFLNRAYIDVQRAHSLAVLGENIAAAEAFGHAIDSLPDGYHRDRGIYYVRKALAHASGEEPEQAADTGLHALAIGAETNSARIITGLARLNRTLSKWNTVARVAEFRHALAEVRFAERASFPSKEESQ
jgi:transcriptional regulator with XRE-family HTH domain/tetratricopeptide (TPR) repeat protein